MKMLSVRLDDAEAAALKAVCEAKGLSRSDAVKRAILEFAQAEHRKPFGQVAGELGLVGCFAGARNLGDKHSEHVRRAQRAKTAG
jgi:hypothetical protein